MKNEFFMYYKELSSSSSKILPEFGNHGDNSNQMSNEEILKIRDQQIKD